MGQGIEVRSGDGFIRGSFPEEASLKTGSEELKNEQEFVGQDGKWKGRFRQRGQLRYNCRSVSFVRFPGRTLNGTLGHSPVGGGNPWVRGTLWLEKGESGGLQGRWKLDASLCLPKEGLVPPETSGTSLQPPRVTKMLLGKCSLVVDCKRPWRAPQDQASAQPPDSAWPPHPQLIALSDRPFAFLD